MTFNKKRIDRLCFPLPPSDIRSVRIKVVFPSPRAIFPVLPQVRALALEKNFVMVLPHELFTSLSVSPLVLFRPPCSFLVFSFTGSSETFLPMSLAEASAEC